jgi:hypothetical protein
MTAPQFEDYVPPVQEDSDVFRPKENFDKPLLIKVREFKQGIVTEHSPDGGEGIIVDLVDLTDGKVYRNVLWMGGAIVDGLKAHAGTPKVLVIRFEKRKSNSGRTYPSPISSTDEDKARARSYYESKGDPFAQVFADPTPAGNTTQADDAPPW